MRNRSAYLSILSLFAALVLSTEGTAHDQRQEHGREGKTIQLFNGKDLSGWTPFLEDPSVRTEEVWSFDPTHGVLICKGKPVGYLRTITDYTNYVLRLEWRFVPPVPKDGGSGVLLRLVGPDKIWPRMIEAQVQPGETGDFWVVGGAKLVTPKSRQGYHEGPYDQRIRFRSSEKPVGEWNRYEITVDRERITLRVNGEILNEGLGAEEVAGKIALESEGAEILFRNITLTVLDGGKQ